jgi:hypothetical protein
VNLHRLNTGCGQERFRQGRCKQGKRGQIETFGLAFIVILISIGFFIYVSYKSQQKTDNPQKEFTNDKLASDFVLSVIETSVEGCKEFTVKDLVIDCARDKRITCGEEDSCTALSKSVNTMLNGTFMQRNIKFKFNSENLQGFDGNELLNVSYLGCGTASSSQGQSGIAIVSLYPVPGSVFLKMNICY